MLSNLRERAVHTTLGRSKAQRYDAIRGLGFHRWSERTDEHADPYKERRAELIEQAVVKAEPQ
jgi:hypothetical protein